MTQNDAGGCRAAALMALEPALPGDEAMLRSPDGCGSRAAVDSASPPRKGRAIRGQCEQEQPHWNLRKKKRRKLIQPQRRNGAWPLPLVHWIALAPPGAPGHRQAAHSQRKPVKYADSAE